MTLASYINAMPKAELNVHLEGAFRRQTLLMLAEQNEIPETVKHFQSWLALLEKPDYKRLPEIARMTASWLKYSDDLKRLAYDLGVWLHHQNIKYAEVGVNFALYDGLGLKPDDLLAALNEGRDRAERGWGVEMQWLLMASREEPRRADEIARYAAAVASRKLAIAALGLTGKEDAQPIGQFEHAFRMVAEKKGLPRVARAGEILGAEGIAEVLEVLAVNRIVDAWGLLDSPETLRTVVDAGVPVVVSPYRALRHGWISRLEDYPLRPLYDAGVLLVLSCDQPAFYGATLNDVYLAAVEKCGLTVDELEDIALNAVRASFLPEERKTEILAQFKADYSHLRAEHLSDAAA